jgi:hypothetical protein
MWNRRGAAGGANILVLPKFLQAGKDLVAGWENDGEDTPPTGLMKQFGLHGSLSYVWPRPVFKPEHSPPLSRAAYRSFVADLKAAARSRTLVPGSDHNPVE